MARIRTARISFRTIGHLPLLALSQFFRWPDGRIRARALTDPPICRVLAESDESDSGCDRHRRLGSHNGEPEKRVAPHITRRARDASYARNGAMDNTDTGS